MPDHDGMLVVWNRACEYAGTGVGDRHLSALILVDGMVHNGGPNRAADGCEPAELAAAAAAAAWYFGVEDLAAVIEELPDAASGYEEEDIDMRLTRKYQDVLQDYGPLEAGIAARYAAAPQDFDPLR